jgi:hypothetical protein
LIGVDFVAKIFKELFERLSFIGLDKTIQQFQGADGAGKVRKLPSALPPKLLIRTLPTPKAAE